MARLNLDLSETHNDLVVKLMAMCNLKTKTDVVENGLMLLGWAAKAAREGFIIAAVNEDGKTYREIETPALIGARRVKEKETEPQIQLELGKATHGHSKRKVA